MDQMIEFLTSKEIVVVYIVVGLAVILSLVIYIIDKTYAKRKRRQNTRELNKLVEKVDLSSTDAPKKERVKVAKPSMQVVEPKVEESRDNIEMITDDTDFVPVVNSLEQEKEDIETLSIDNIEELEQESSQSIEEAMNQTIDKVHDKIEQIVYTSNEPDPEEATRELLKLTEELEKAEQKQREGIDIDAYENAQEENAIISLDELSKRSEEMYAANEVTQYADEGNEPISIDDLERRKAQSYSKELEEEKIKNQNTIILEQEQMNFNDAYHGSVSHNNDVFSSVFSKPKSKIVQTEEELQKTSEFLLSLKELQSRLNS